MSGARIWDSGRPLEIPWQSGEDTNPCSTIDELNWFFFWFKSPKSRTARWFETQSNHLFAWQANRAIKTVHENKRDQEILYTLTIPHASVKDSGIYACSITDIISNENQTKQLAITVYGIKLLFVWMRHYFMNLYLSLNDYWRSVFFSLSLRLKATQFMFLSPEFGVHESAELDEVREFRAAISSFPSAHVTWLKDGLPLSDVTAEISSSLRQVNETRWDSHPTSSNYSRAKGKFKVTFPHWSDLSGL